MEFPKCFEIFEKIKNFFELVRPKFLGLDFLKNAFSLFGVFPKSGLVGEGFFFLDFLYFNIVVKDTSSRHQVSPLNL